MLSAEGKAGCLARGVFGGLDENIRLAVAERMGEQELEDGQLLFLEGEPGTDVFVVVSGEVEIFRGEVGQHRGAAQVRGESVLARLGPGELIGEMAVLGAGKRTAGGRARGSTRLLFLKDKALRLLIQQTPDIAFAIFDVLVERLSEATDCAVFLHGERKAIGRVEVASGDIAGRSFPIHREQTVLGRSLGSVAADGTRLALPTSNPELLERHALVTAAEGSVFIEPLDGAITLEGIEVADRVALGPDDVVCAGGLALRLRLDAESGAAS